MKIKLIRSYRSQNGNATFVYGVTGSDADLKQYEDAQGEYYITDCPAVFLAQGKEVRALAVLQPDEAMGINNLAELAVVEEAMAKRA